MKIKDKWKNVEEVMKRKKYVPIPKETIEDGLFSQEECTEYNTLVQKANGFLGSMDSQQKKLMNNYGRYMLDGLSGAVVFCTAECILASLAPHSEGNTMLGGLYLGILTASALDAVQKLINRRRQKSLVNYFENNVDDFNHTSMGIEEMSRHMRQSLKTKGCAALEDLTKTTDLTLYQERISQEQDAERLEVSVNESAAKLDNLKTLVSEYKSSMQVLDGNQDLAGNKIDKKYSKTKPRIRETVRSIGLRTIRAALSYALLLGSFNVASDIKADTSQTIARWYFEQEENAQSLQNIKSFVDQEKTKYGLNNVEIMADFLDYDRDEKEGSYFVPGNYVIVLGEFKRDFVRRELYKIREFELNQERNQGENQGIRKIPAKTFLGLNLVRAHSLVTK